MKPIGGFSAATAERESNRAAAAAALLRLGYKLEDGVMIMGADGTDLFIDLHVTAGHVEVRRAGTGRLLWQGLPHRIGECMANRDGRI